MKLQIKYNFTDVAHALVIAQQTAPYADILEVGSLLLLHYGIESVKKFKDAFPDKEIYADAKIADKGEEAVELLANAGATYISMLAGTFYAIIKKATAVAEEYKAKIVLDFINAGSVGQSAMEAKNLGVYAILLHRAQAPKGTIDLDENWQMVKANTDLPIFIKGRITAENLKDIMRLKPHGITVGSAITHAANPAHEAERIKKMLEHL